MLHTGTQGVIDRSDGGAQIRIEIRKWNQEIRIGKRGADIPPDKWDAIFSVSVLESQESAMLLMRRVLGLT